MDMTEGRHLPRPGVLFWRFISGNHLDGRRRTNATWMRPGTRPKEALNWWNRKPRLERAFWRWSFSFGFIFDMWLAAFHPLVWLWLSGVEFGFFIRTAYHRFMAWRDVPIRVHFRDSAREVIDELNVDTNNEMADVREIKWKASE